MSVVMRVLRYLKSTLDQGLLLPSFESLYLKDYCDASWMSFPSTRRSSIGYFISLGGVLVSWRTKK